MSEKVGDISWVIALSKQLRRTRMANRMRPELFGANIQFLEPKTHDFVYRPRVHRTKRRVEAKEEMVAGGAGRPNVLNIVAQRAGNISLQWKLLKSASFRAAHSKNVIVPIKIVQL